MNNFHPLDAKDMAQLRHIDRPWLTRLVVKLFARRFNRIASSVLCRAYERGVINSHQMHALAAQFDPTQRGVVGLLSERARG